MAANERRAVIMKRRFLLSGMILLMVLGSTFPSLALDRVTLRLDWVLMGKGSPFFVGVEKGYYKEVGIDLTILEGKGSGSTIQLIASGEDPVGLASLANLAEAVAKGMPVKSVYAVTHDSGYAVLSLVETGIKNPKDLIGKTVGVSPAGASRAVLPAFLKVNGIEFNQIKEVAFEGVGRMNALLMKKVDSAIGPYYEYLPILESKGVKVNTLKLAEWGLSLLGFGVVVNNKLIAENPDLIKRFLQATSRSLAYAMANQDEAIKAMSKDYIKPEPQIWAYDWKLVIETMDSKYMKGRPMGWQPQEEWEQTRDFLGRYINKDIGQVPLDKFYTNDFISQ